jgi:NAD(P)-dependent dehydrogenase (short-subunit alcohol dehydrogenase family)
MEAQGAGFARPLVAAVTGAAMGIGRAVGKRLMGDSLSVVGLDRDETALTSAADAIGERFTPAVRDVGEWDDHEQAADVAAELEALRHWMNNAGIDSSDPALEVTAAHIQESLRVLQLGPHVRMRGRGAADAGRGRRGDRERLVHPGGGVVSALLPVQVGEGRAPARDQEDRGRLRPRNARSSPASSRRR